ncbi:MAG: 2-oxoglutarate and iron-dependent oxygenase domain-containing protein, partial [Ginsengibacter sp.]
MTIPVVDLADFISNDHNRKKDFVKELGKAFENVGFVAVKNHGISATLIAELYKDVQQFFSLPSEKKKNYEISGLAGQRGYTSFGKEHAKGSNAPDLKEFFQYGQVVAKDHKLKYEYPDNVKVKDISGFDTTIFDAYRAFEKSGKHLLQAIALYLGLDENYFDDFVEEGNSIVRAI